MRVCTRRGWPAAVVLLALAGCGGQNGGFALFGKPKDEDVWSIRCITIAGVDAANVAGSYARALRSVPGLKPGLVQTIDDESGTAVFYGRYVRRFDALTGKQTYTPEPRNELNLIRQLALSTSDEWPFRLAQLEPLPAEEIGDAAWDLRNADGYWSLNVAVFYNTGEMRARRQAAVDYCKLLREQGHEAYFHHGQVNSSVCVGAFPKGAIEQQSRADPVTGIPTTVSRIVDERMLETQKKFPHNLENGHIMKEVIRDASTNEIVNRIPLPSFPVLIPRGEELERPAADDRH